jgi:hypothetical protein
VSRATVAKDLVAAQARALKMPGLARVFGALARQAREEHWGYEECLHDVLTAEQSSRHESAIPICLSSTSWDSFPSIALEASCSSIS